MPDIARSRRLARAPSGRARRTARADASRSGRGHDRFRITRRFSIGQAIPIVGIAPLTLEIQPLRRGLAQAVSLRVTRRASGPESSGHRAGRPGRLVPNAEAFE